jgi:hypothetical protein
MSDDLNPDDDNHKDYANPEGAAGQGPEDGSAIEPSRHKSESSLGGSSGARQAWEDLSDLSHITEMEDTVSTRKNLAETRVEIARLRALAAKGELHQGNPAPRDKKEADLATIRGMTAGMSAVMREAATTTLADNSEVIGLGNSGPINPIKDDFGVWRSEKVYESGVKPADVVSGGGAVEYTTITDDGTTRVVKIAKTPPGLPQIISAGSLGEYLMLTQVQKPGLDERGKPYPPEDKPRYLDRADLAGVVIKKQKPNEPKVTKFGENFARGEGGRQIKTPGKVTSVRSLH